ncbi:hypothetical protein ACFL3Q_07670 [Planctomycetota bacterium]
MKRLITILIVLAIVCAIALPADADVRVRGYYRSNGTYVRPHYRSNPDGNFRNNWSTYPNINPYTGAIGTRRTPSYSGSYSWRTPSYNWNVPSYRNSYSWSFPSYTAQSYSTFGSSLWSR